MSGTSRRRRDCHSDATPCVSLLKHLLQVQGGVIKMTVSPTARHLSLYYSGAGESWLTAATPMNNLYCSCKLTRVRRLPAERLTVAVGVAGHAEPRQREPSARLPFCSRPLYPLPLVRVLNVEGGAAE